MGGRTSGGPLVGREQANAPAAGAEDQREHGLLQGRHHLAAAERSKIAAPALARAVGVSTRELGEVTTVEHLLANYPLDGLMLDDNYWLDYSDMYACYCDYYKEAN